MREVLEKFKAKQLLGYTDEQELKRLEKCLKNYTRGVINASEFQELTGLTVNETKEGLECHSFPGLKIG